MSKDIYSYYCISEGKFIKENVNIDEPLPTVCKNNNAHTINSSTMTISYKAPRLSDLSGESLTVSRKCDVYYKPISNIAFTTTWTDVPMNIERILDSDFSHTADSAEITINTSDYYMIIAKCSGYNTSNNRSASQFRLVLDTGSGYTQVGGTITYLYHRRDGFVGYASASTPAIIKLNSGDKIKVQIQILEGDSTLYIPSEGASIVIKNV
jgi:hypothetical protein